MLQPPHSKQELSGPPLDRRLDGQQSYNKQDDQKKNTYPCQKQNLIIQPVASHHSN